VFAFSKFVQSWKISLDFFFAAELTQPRIDILYSDTDFVQVASRQAACNTSVLTKQYLPR